MVCDARMVPASSSAANSAASLCGRVCAGSPVKRILVRRTSSREGSRSDALMDRTRTQSKTRQDLANGPANFSVADLAQDCRNRLRLKRLPGQFKVVLDVLAFDVCRRLETQVAASFLGAFAFEMPKGILNVGGVS